MHSKLKMFALALFLCAPGAFAAEIVAVNIPFDFESGGQHFQASQYDVKLDDLRLHIILTNRQIPSKRVSLLAQTIEKGPDAPELSIRFENAGGVRALSVVRLGSYQSYEESSRSNFLLNGPVSSISGK